MEHSSTGEDEGPSTAPVGFVWEGRPRSLNRPLGKAGARVRGEFPRLYSEAGGNFSEGLRYGVVYWFVDGYSPATDPDAGNISKRVWDSLDGTAYGDDHVVRLQVSGVIDIGAGTGNGTLEDIDLRGIPAPALIRLLELIQSKPTTGFVYVETGPLKPAMFSLNIAGRKATR